MMKLIISYLYYLDRNGTGEFVGRTTLLTIENFASRTDVDGVGLMLIFRVIPVIPKG